jgi:hypothetical protein
MAFKKTELIKLLQFLEELVRDPENDWFKDELSKLFNNPANNIPTEVIDDIRRTRYYLRNIDKNYYQQGYKIYKNVKDVQLKKELIADYKEMNIALNNNDILEYGRRASLQLEKCFDAVIMTVNGWEEVNKKKELYTEVSTDINGKYKYSVRNGFFKKDFKNPSEIIRKELSEIEFRIKALFCCLYYEVDFLYHWLNLENIYFLRNKASHGLLNDKDSNRLKKLIDKFPENNGFYYKTFHYLIKSLKAIYLTDH